MGGRTRRKQTQTTQQTNSPPAWALPLFQEGAAAARDLYQSGKGGNVYQGKRVADLSGATQQGLQGLGRALDGFSASAATGQPGKPTAAQSNLADMANGSYLQQGNPYYRQRLNDAVNDMSAKVNSQMAGAGRYGSGANSAVLAKNTSAMMLDGLEKDYNAALQNMLSANKQIDSSNQNALRSQGEYLRNQSDAAAGLLRGGQVADNHEQDTLDAARQKWEDEDNQGWRRLGYLQNAAQGFANGYGTQTGSSTSRSAERRNPWDTLSGLGGLTRKR